MAYGTLKCDNITFTNGGIDQTVTVSGIVQSISGNITATGTIQAATIIGTSTVSGATVTGDSGQYGNLNGISGVFTTQLSGATITGDIGQYATLTGISGVFTTAISGATITGDAGNYSELTAISGVFTTQVSGATVTGDAGSFATVTGGVATITSGVFALGTNSLPSISFSSDPNTGIYSPGADQLALSTNGTGRLFIDSSGRLLVGTTSTSTTATAVFQGNSGGATSHGIVNLARGTTNPGVNLSLGFTQFQDAAGSVGAQIYAQTDAAWSSGSYAGRLLFSTTADGASSPTERMRITNDGKVGVGTTTVDSLFHVSEPSNTSLDVLFAARGGNGLSSEIRFLTKNSGGSNTGGAIGFDASAGLCLTASATSIDSAKNIIIDSSGRLLVGTTSTFDANCQVQVVGNITQAAQFFRIGGSDNTTVYIGSARGTAATPLVLASTDTIGTLAFRSYDGSAYANGATIKAEIDGITPSSDLPTRLVFSVTADAAATPTERMRITNDGVFGYNQPAPVAVDTTATLTVANLKTGIITSTTAAAVTMTLPTGTLTEAGFSGLYNNFTFEWTVINTGATNAVTVQGDTDHTLVGSGTVAAGVSGRFASRRTAANTFVTYRLS